ncbi:hypothetical protein ACWGJT_32630 [Streptomyces xantholiticus]
MTRRIGRGGRKGQTHTASPTLRSYDVSPASDVTVTRADGAVVSEPAKQAKATTTPALRKGPAVCALCGEPIGGPVLFSHERGPARGKPVHGGCDPTARPKPPRRPAAVVPQRAPRARKPAPGTCPQCGAAPGERCTVQYADGTSAQVEIGHAKRRPSPAP